MNNNFVIDFDRINYLTSHINDNQLGGGYMPTFAYSLTRKILKEYMEIYNSYKTGHRNITYETYSSVVETLKYNKILISPSDIRNEKIEKIVNA